VALATLAARGLAAVAAPTWVPVAFTLLVWVPLFFMAVFVADLVTEDDLSLAAGMDLQRPWARRLRDPLVGAGLRLSRAVGAVRPGALATVEGS